MASVDRFQSIGHKVADVRSRVSGEWADTETALL
jgi:hypothetical protein